jgi:hypothetical protein
MMQGSTCIQFGLGIMNACGFVGHNEAILGFNNFATYLPERDAVILVAVNEYHEDSSVPPTTTV